MSSDGDRTTADGGQTRRRVLQVAAGGAIGTVGLGSLTGLSAAYPWYRFDVVFDSCCTVVILVDPRDLDPSVVENYPLVADVIVAEPGGSIRCELVEFTREETAVVESGPGGAAMRSYTADPGERILGVIRYNDRDLATSEPSCLVRNGEACASETDGPAVEAAPCVQAAVDGHWNGSVWDGCESVGVDGLRPALRTAVRDHLADRPDCRGDDEDDDEDDEDDDDEHDDNGHDGKHDWWEKDRRDDPDDSDGGRDSSDPKRGWWDEKHGRKDDRKHDGKDDHHGHSWARDTDEDDDEDAGRRRDRGHRGWWGH